MMLMVVGDDVLCTSRPEGDWRDSDGLCSPFRGGGLAKDVAPSLAAGEFPATFMRPPTKHLILRRAYMRVTSTARASTYVSGANVTYLARNGCRCLSG